jgi:hypothetical protein
MKNKASHESLRVARASRVLAMTSRHRGLFLCMKIREKFVSARRRNQHAGRVRYSTRRTDA